MRYKKYRQLFTAFKRLVMCDNFILFTTTQPTYEHVLNGKADLAILGVLPSGITEHIKNNWDKLMELAATPDSHSLTNTKTP